MRVPIRPIESRWSPRVQRRLSRFFWVDPAVVVDPAASPEQFSRAMAAVHVGETIKITGANRHGPADQLLLDNVDLADALIVDIGASDGTTSLELIEKLPAFGRFVIADRYLTVRSARVGRRTVWFDDSGTAVLVQGPRMLAWPSLSDAIRGLYAPVLRRAARRPREEILLLNPRTRERLADDPRVTWREHDVFRPWPDEQPDVIKIANLLRRLYFSDADIARALEAVLQSLKPGGHLLMVDNPRIEGIAVRAGLYRRVADHFEPVAQTEHAAEIDDLVRAAGR